MGEVNVKEHGATGNGTTDDAPAIRVAIDEALSSGINAVFFPPGIYLCARDGRNAWSLNLSGSNIMLRGIRGASWLKHPAGLPNTSVALLRVNNKERVIIRELGFDGNWGNEVGYSDAQAGLYVASPPSTSGQMTQADHITTVATGSHGQVLSSTPSTIHVANATPFAPSGTFYVRTTDPYRYEQVTYTGKGADHFTGCTGGRGTLATGNEVFANVDPQNHLVMVRGGEGILIEHCSFRQSYGDMIWIGSSTDTSETYKIGAKNVHIRDCDGYLSARHAVALAQKCEGVTVSNCRFKYAYIESFDSEASDMSIRNVIVKDSHFETWWNPSNVNRAGNIAVTIAGGKSIIPSETNYIRNVRIQNCTLVGTALIGDAVDVVFENNRITCDWDNFSYSPILIQAYCNNIRILGNWIYDRTTAHSTGPAQHQAAISLQFYGGAGNNVQPSGVLVGGNTILARNGRHGIKIAGTGTRAYGVTFQPGISGTSTAINDTSLIDNTAHWTANQWIGYRVRIGAAWGTVVSNSPTVLTLVTEVNYPTAWTSPLGDPIATPSNGTYTIFQIDGLVDVFDNQIDCTNDGRGPGGLGILATAERAGMKVRIRDNAIKNAMDAGIRVTCFDASALRPFLYLSISNNYIWDDQLTPTCTAGIRFSTAQWFKKLVLGGNEAGEGLTTLYAGLTRGYWRTTEGGLAGVWEGFGTPEGHVTDRVGAQYRQLDGGAGTCLWVKESGAGNTGWEEK